MAWDAGNSQTRRLTRDTITDIARKCRRESQRERGAVLDHHTQVRVNLQASSLLREC